MEDSELGALQKEVERLRKLLKQKEQQLKDVDVLVRLVSLVICN